MSGTLIDSFSPDDDPTANGFEENTFSGDGPDDIYVKPLRAIGTILPNVVVEEEHVDQMEITLHPVETGSAITDHAFKRPSEVTIRCGWSNSAPDSNGTETYVQEVYLALLALQASREPFVIVTGKRIYDSMLIASLSVTTDKDSEFALQVTATCREIILVSTQSTTLPPQAQQAMPQKTAEPVNTGDLTPAPVGDKESVLHQRVGRIGSVRGVLSTSLGGN